MTDLESRTRNALRQFDSNMSGIFDRASFYDQHLYSQAAHPQLSKTQNCFKFTLLAWNVLFLVFGIVLIAVGSYAVNNPVGVLTGASVATGIIVVGVFILLLSIVGGVAAWRELRALLLIYFIFLLIFTIILLGLGIAVYVEKDDSRNLISQGWNLTSPDVKTSLQQLFDCCGLVVYGDSNIPCPTSSADTNRTCLDTLVDDFNSYYITAGGCGIGFAVVMLLGMVFVCVLMEGIKRKHSEQDLAKLRAANVQDAEEVEPAVGHKSRRDERSISRDDDEEDDEDEDFEEDEEMVSGRRR